MFGDNNGLRFEFPETNGIDLEVWRLTKEISWIESKLPVQIQKFWNGKKIFEKGCLFILIFEEFPDSVHQGDRDI